MAGNLPQPASTVATISEATSKKTWGGEQGTRARVRAIRERFLRLHAASLLRRCEKVPLLD